jgi:hypothetical protein
MLTITVLFVIAGVVLGITTKRSNIETAFALVSSVPVILLLGSIVGLRVSDNSVVFFSGFVVSFFLSLLATALGIGFTIVRYKNRAPVRKQLLLCLLASCPILWAVVKRSF